MLFFVIGSNEFVFSCCNKWIFWCKKYFWNLIICRPLMFDMAFLIHAILWQKKTNSALARLIALSNYIAYSSRHYFMDCNANVMDIATFIWLNINFNQPKIMLHQNCLCAEKPTDRDYRCNLFNSKSENSTSLIQNCDNQFSSSWHKWHPPIASTSANNNRSNSSTNISRRVDYNN